MNGRRLLIDASYMPWSTGKERAALDRVVHSIRFLAASTRKTASTAAAPSLAVRGVTVSDINDRGQIVGSLTPRSGYGRGFVWENGSLKLLGRGRFVDVNGINERGQILGSSGDDQHGVLWEDGKTVKLGLTLVWALNDRGQVLGGEVDGSSAVWTNGTIRWLPFGAAAINDRGQIVGGTKDGKAAEWRRGKLTYLGAGSPSRSTTEAKSSETGAET